MLDAPVFDGSGSQGKDNEGGPGSLKKVDEDPCPNRDLKMTENDL